LRAAGRDRAGRVLALIALTLVALFAWTAAARAAAPVNDNFADATTLPSVLPFEKEGTNVEATKEAGEPNHAGNGGGHSVWYSWTPSSSGPAGVQSASCFELDALVAVYTGPSVNSLTPVASNATPSSPSCFFSELPQAEFEAVAGTTYWIAVDGRDGDQNAFTLKFSGPPSNDDFADATELSAEPPVETFATTKLAGKETGEPNHAGDPGGHSVWFTWEPTASEPVHISSCSSFSGLDAVLAVYTGNAVNALTEVASNDEGPLGEGFPGCPWSDSELTLDAQAGTTYRIAVDGADATSGRFSLRIRGRPANDDFDSPQTLGAGLPVFASQTNNEFATKETGEPNHAGNGGGHSVWYSWTPSSSGRVNVSTCSTDDSLDPVLAVYIGSELTGLSLVGANDDGAQPNCQGTDSEVGFIAAAGATYRIAVDGKDGDEGRFGLSIEAPPANDDFADAKVLSAGLPVYDGGSTRFATKEGGEPDHAGDPGGHSVWYSWTPSSSGPVSIVTCSQGKAADTLLAVYTGSAVNALAPVASNDDSPSACGDTDSAVQFSASAGTTYRIAVDAKEAKGYFSLELGGPPDNDDFADATALPVFPIAPGGSTVFATKEAGEPNHAGNVGGHSVWFTWTPEESGPVAISTCGRNPEVDTLLGVYTGSAVEALTPVASNDDAGPVPSDEFCEGPDGRSEVMFDASAGTAYRIAVDTKNGEGRFGMDIEQAPENDDFADARPLSAALPSSDFGITKLASKEAGEPNHAGDPGGHSVWYSWTPSSSGPVAVTTCSHQAGFDSVLAVYTGSELLGLTPVASGDDGVVKRPCRSSDSEAEFTATAGTTYRIAVDGKAGSTGSFQLFVEGVARNDDFIDAQPLGGSLPAQWQLASNRFATEQLGEPEHAGEAGGSSVWFKWTAPRSTTVSVDTCDSGFDTLLAVYSGAELASLTPVASNDDGSGACAPRSKLTFSAVANTTYRIAVDGKEGAQGDLELHIEGTPKNDDFDRAEMVPGILEWYWPGSSILATKEAGEPNHAGDPGGHSVWYSWTPPRTRTVELEACSHSFDPLLAVYTGSAVDGLTAVASTDAGSGECDEGRSIRFTATAGTTYRLAIDGAEGGEGHFELHLHPVLRSLSILRAGSGTGTVAASRAGIDCGTTCSHEFEDGTVLTLTATPVAGSTFAGWSGGGCSGTAPCQLALDADTSVTATFEQMSGGGGGESSGGGGGEPTPPAPASPPATRPHRCKPGFKKKRVHGKVRCVRKHKKHKRHRRHP
jgi:List-Bact-rpt repeat protein